MKRTVSGVNAAKPPAGCATSANQQNPLTGLDRLLRHEAFINPPSVICFMHYNKLKEKWALETAQRKAFSSRLKMKLREKGFPIFKRYGISKAVLFGSLQHGQCHDRSDIDLLVFSLDTNQYWDFRHDLEQALDYPLDVYTQTDDPVFVQKVLKRGEKIYEVQS
ncbi:nucleotidyltransferase domain protein [delta proteobacterium NaphS2]|nr:nucleotidyltransferase domain protein [delta proteobacterium NaphS2]